MSLGSVEQAFLLWLWTKTSDTASERVCVRAPVKEGTREQRTRLEQVLQVLSKLFISVPCLQRTDAEGGFYDKFELNIKTNKTNYIIVC